MHWTTTNIVMAVASAVLGCGWIVLMASEGVSPLRAGGLVICTACFFMQFKLASR